MAVASPTQRARNTRRLGSAAARRTRQETTDDERDPNFSGVIKGSDFDWRSAEWIEPETGELYDGGDRRAREIQDAVKSDHKMAQLARVLTSSIQGADWKLTPHKDDQDGKIAADTEERLRRPPNAGGMAVPMRLVLAQASSSIFLGRSFFYRGWKLDPKLDGSVLYSRIAMRPASTCRLRADPTGQAFNGFAQDIVFVDGQRKQGWDGKPIQFEPKESLVFLNGQDREPFGVSDLEVAMWCWRTKRKVLQLALAFLAAAAGPRTMVGYKDNDAGKAKRAAAEIAKIGSSGVGYYDKLNTDLDVLQVAGEAFQAYLEMLKYMDSCAGGSVLAGFTDLTSMASAGRGSLALSKDASDMFNQTRKQAADGIAETMSSFAVADLVKHNHGRQAPMPVFTFEPLAGINDDKIMTLLQALATSQAGLPREFISQLTLHMAQLFDLDVDQIKKGIERDAKAAEDAAKQLTTNPAAPAAAAAGAAVQKAKKVVMQVAGKAA